MKTFRNNPDHNHQLIGTTCIPSVSHSARDDNTRCSTPKPDNTLTVEADDAWNPNALTSVTERATHWLENDKLKITRVKLFAENKPNDILEFKEMVGDEVKVRDGRHTKIIPLQYIRGLPPKDVGDLVTPLTGPLIGTAMKVRTIQENVCVVRRPGKVLKKNEKDPSFPTACLIQIFPYAK